MASVRTEIAHCDYAANSGDGEKGMKFWVEEDQDYKTE